MPAPAADPFSTLEPVVAMALASLCAVVATIFIGLILAPRLAWPEKFLPEPERPEDLPDWSWPWLVLLPPLIIVFQLVVFPLRWAGAPRTLWLAFGLSMASGLLCVALAWQLLCRRLGKPAGALGLRLPRWKPHLVLLPILAYPVGMSLMLVALLFQVLVLKRPFPPPQASVKALRSITDPSLRVFAIVAVTMVAPIAEELLFRGVLFRALRFRWGFVAGMLVSAAAFAAVHLDVDHALSIFMLGMVLAFVANESGSLYPGMLLHAMVNGVAVWLAWKIPA